MNREPTHNAPPWTLRRIVDLLFGIFFTVLAAAILIWSDQASFAGSIIAAGAVGGLGIEAIYCAIRDKRSLLSHIGPLP